MSSIESFICKWLGTRIFPSPEILSIVGGREMTKERTVKVNLNNACSVILTQYGAEILNESNKKLEQQCPALKLSRYQAGERYEVQLWQMIQDFGHYMGMECVSPIEMVIELEVEK